MKISLTVILKGIPDWLTNGLADKSDARFWFVNKEGLNVFSFSENKQNCNVLHWGTSVVLETLQR